MKKLTFIERTYATLFVVASNGYSGRSVRQIADDLEVSKVYARRLLEYCVSSGLVSRRDSWHRSNATKATYFMTEHQWDRYQKAGYAGLAHEGFRKNMELIKENTIAKIERIMSHD